MAADMLSTGGFEAWSGVVIVCNGMGALVVCIVDEPVLRWVDVGCTAAISATNFESVWILWQCSRIDSVDQDSRTGRRTIFLFSWLLHQVSKSGSQVAIAAIAVHCSRVATHCSLVRELNAECTSSSFEVEDT